MFGVRNTVEKRLLDQNCKDFRRIKNFKDGLGSLTPVADLPQQIIMDYLSPGDLFKLAQVSHLISDSALENLNYRPQTLRRQFDDLDFISSAELEFFKRIQPRPEVVLHLAKLSIEKENYLLSRLPFVFAYFRSQGMDEGLESYIRVVEYVDSAIGLSNQDPRPFVDDRRRAVRATEFFLISGMGSDINYEKLVQLLEESDAKGQATLLRSFNRRLDLLKNYPFPKNCPYFSDLVLRDRLIQVLRSAITKRFMQGYVIKIAGILNLKDPVLLEAILKLARNESKPYSDDFRDVAFRVLVELDPENRGLRGIAKFFVNEGSNNLKIGADYLLSLKDLTLYGKRH